MPLTQSVKARVGSRSIKMKKTQPFIIPSKALCATAIICASALLVLSGISAPVDREQEEADWLEFYYRNPTPERFVTELKNWSSDGTLMNKSARPALIAFLSQVIRQNRDKLEGWYENLAGLNPEEKSVLHTAMLFSRTKEADALMRKLFGKQYDEQKKETQKILELPLDKRNTIDMLWGFFYATGSEHAIRRVILCFRFLDAPDDPKGVNVPQGYVPLFKELPRIAYISLASNCERHPDIIKLCEKFYTEDDSLIPAEKGELYDLLSEFLPKKYPPKKAAKPEEA